jgi:N-acetylmuramoyl-L-alanine amidase
MKGVSRITIHHEGHTPVWFTDERSTKARLEQVRSIHTRDRRWGDIGYHYIIDRAGRIIEGRSVAYQGAHVSKQNPHNIGVMLLGNFEKQSPSQAQLTALQSTLRHLMGRYKVPVNRVYTHRELGPTVCPGRNLQPRIASLRTSGALA